jgi:hypothetical protein
VSLGILGIGNRKPKIENWSFFLSFQAGNNYQKICLKFFIFYLFIYLYFFSRPRGRSPASVQIAEGREGEGGGEGREGRREGRKMHQRGRPCPRGCWAASARTHPCVRADVWSRPLGRECVHADAFFTASADCKNPSADKIASAG